MPTIDDVLQLLELMPMGGIGPHGATLTEIEAAEAAGHDVENDAVYHLAQKAWLLLDQIRQQSVGTQCYGLFPRRADGGTPKAAKLYDDLVFWSAEEANSYGACDKFGIEYEVREMTVQVGGVVSEEAK